MTDVHRRAFSVLIPCFYAPDITDQSEWRGVQKKMERDCPAILRKHPVVFSGLGRGWVGWKRRDMLSSHAHFTRRQSGALNAVLAWITHLLDTVRLARKETVAVFAGNAVAAFGIVLLRSLFPKRLRVIVRVQGRTASKALMVRHSRWRFKLIDLFESYVFRRADLLVPMGPYTRELALAKGANPAALLTVPFPVPWAPDAKVKPIPVEPIVLFVGRLEKEKGVHVLLEAIRSIRDVVPGVRLLIAGDGPCRDALEATAGSLGIKRDVTFLGWLPPVRLPELYNSARVLVLPSIWEEGLGMVLVEAGLCGRPVIASKLGGTGDVVTDGVSGFLVPPGQAEPLAQVIRKILQDDALATQMGARARARAIDYLAERASAMSLLENAIYSLYDTHGVRPA